MSYQLSDLLGGPVVFGESSRGPQDADLIGAMMRSVPGLQRSQAAALARVVARGIIRQSSQLGFISQDTVTGTGNTNPIGATGRAQSATTRTQRPFKPCKLFVQEFASVVDSASTPVNRAGSNATAIDIFLSGAFTGGDNAFPNAPDTSIADGGTSVNCAIFNANNLGSGISWADIPGGIDAQLNFIAASSLIGALLGTTGALTGLTGATTYTLTISATIMGPMTAA